MDASRELSVGELIEHLLADSLIDAAHITEASVTVIQGAERHSFPHEQARTFLLGMVRGRSWHLTTDEAERVASRPEPSGTEIEALDAVGKPEMDCGSANSPIGGADAPSHAGLIEETDSPLDVLLTMAVDMGVIASASQDATSGTVRVELSSCKTQMSQNEATVFVTECILNGLNALRTDVLRQPESAPNSQPTANIPGAQESPHRSASDRPEQRRRARSAGVDTPSRAGTVGGRPIWEPLSRCMRTSGIQ